jgi:hypothetical protein
MEAFSEAVCVFVLTRLFIFLIVDRFARNSVRTMLLEATQTSYLLISYNL